MQTTTLDRWGDGSVRWLLAEFQADVVPHAASFYALAPDRTATNAGPAMAIEHAGEVLRVAHRRGHDRRPEERHRLRDERERG